MAYEYPRPMLRSLVRQRRRKMTAPGLMPIRQDPVMDDVEALADHVILFSLAGIRAVRERIESEKSTKKKE